jgi:CelD/BcsL family acetyltransferase involved in cellulose biosynthesis
VEVLADVQPIEREWDELADRTRSSPFLRPGWFLAWWRAFGHGRLELVSLRRERRLVGVIPTVRIDGRLRSATNFETPEFGFVAEDALARQTLANALFRDSPRNVLIRYLDGVGPDDEFLRRAAARAGYRMFERGSMISPFVQIRGSWEQYERALSSNVRGDVRRRRRRLEEAGNLALEIDRGRDRLEGRLEEGYRIEGSGWKEARGSAIRSSPEMRAFYTAIAEWAAERGWLRLCFLRLDSRAIAFHLDVAADGILYHLKGGFDADFARFSPGKVLHYLMVEHAFEQGLHRYDFLGEDERYKVALATGTHERRQFHAFAPRVVAQAERLAHVFARPVGRRLLELRRHK